MLVPAAHDAIDEIADCWRRAERVVALTGAGMSTASGIPDFRSAGGRWSAYQPVTIQEFEATHESRVEYWRYKGETWQVIQEAQPNPAHQALTELARANALELLVTQNVDGLHRTSGFPLDRLITIHGTDSQVECLRCGDRQPRGPAQQMWEGGVEVPTCQCGGWLKPATISFGQSLVMADLQRAFEQASSCDLFLAAGTSLVVSPIHQMVSQALHGGAKIAILTASETPFDEAASWTVNEPLEESLPRLRDLILRR